MTGIVINNNKYEISTGSTKIEYSSMGEGTVSYSIYGDNVPFTPLVKECEWIQSLSSTPFIYKNNFSTDIEYKVRFCCQYNGSPYLLWCYIEGNSSTYARSYLEYGRTTTAVDFSRAYFILKRAGYNKDRIIYYGGSGYSEYLPALNTVFTLGFKGGKFYSDSTGKYEQRYTYDSNPTGSPSLPFSLNYKPEFKFNNAYKIYQIEEDNNVYKFFYNTDKNIFIIKEINSNEIMMEIPASEVTDYKLKA